MAKKVFNVDEFLANKEVLIQLGDKEFLVQDISLDVMKQIDELRNSKDITAIRDMLKAILGCDEKDLEPYGLVAYNAILEAIYDNFFPDISQKRVLKS